MTLAYYEDALAPFQDHLPDWWAAQNTTSVLYAILAAFATPTDGLSTDLETLHADQTLLTATLDGLRSEYSFAYGIDFEQLPPTVDALRQYIQVWMGVDGSTPSIVRALIAFLSTPVNLSGTQPLFFDAGGGGLTFPSDGSGLPLFQPGTGTAFTGDTTSGQPTLANTTNVNLLAPGMFVSGPGIPWPTTILSISGTTLTLSNNATATAATASFTAFATTSATLQFPVDGSGLKFPVFGAPPLAFPVAGWVTVTENFTAYAWTVTTKSYLNFDRAAFARAVERLRQAHLLPAVIVEEHT